MADILIKGMDKPKGCADCRFHSYSMLWTENKFLHKCYVQGLAEKTQNEAEKLYGSCPLVELPPYSVLKDTGAIIENMEKAFSELFPIDGKHRQTIVSECHKAFLRAVLDAPTVLEAST